MQIPDEVVLQYIANDTSVDRSAMYIENDIVFYTEPDGDLRTACAKGTPYWRELEALAMADKIIAAVKR
jgi:hypothetical protein